MKTEMKRLSDPSLAADLFSGWEETMIYSCLEGTTGSVYAECMDGKPLSAVCIAVDFAFFSGIPSPSLITHDYGKSFLILTPRDRAWQLCIERTLAPDSVYSPDQMEWQDPVCGPYGKLHKVTRYAIRKDTVFDRAHLEAIRDRLAEGFILHPMEEAEYYECASQPWSCDFVQNYPTYEEYRKHALGYVIKTEKDTIVAGASAYTFYSGGIEIEVDTREDNRQRGLASVCSAALILACLDRGLYPSWDAANLISVHLAEKLGYTLAHPYAVYYFSR